MKRFEGLSLTLVLAVAGAVTGCDRDQSKDWQASNGAARVCVDHDGKRVPDDQCAAPVRAGGGVSPFLWYYLGTLNRGAPPYGGYVSGGGYRPMPGVVYGRAPAEGGVARGGFGGTARSFGGIGEGAGE